MTPRGKTSLLYVGTLCLLGLVACGGGTSKPANPSPPVQKPPGYPRLSTTASMDKDMLAPFRRARFYDSLDEVKKIDKTKLDGLNLGFIAFNLFIDYQETRDIEYLVTAKGYLDYLMNGYPTRHSTDTLVTWRYNFAWGDLAPGWWSCMDNAINALAFRAGYETFGDPRYEEMSRKSLNGLLSTVQEGGSALWVDSESFWLSEYTWPGGTLENEYYVLNGYTFSLLALRVIASVTGDANYATKYRQALNSYKQISERYYAPGGNWTYYSLNPLDIEAMHYAIFDCLLLDALYKISNDPFFADEVARRRQIFRKEYPLRIDSAGNFLFSLMGPPWPYWLDTYVVKIDFLNEDKLLAQYKSASGYDYSIPPKDRYFLSGEVPQGATKASVWSESNGQKFKLFDVNLSEIERSTATEPVDVGFTLDCAYDAVCQDANNLIIDSSIVSVPGVEHYTNTQGRIIITPAIPILRSENKYLGLKLAPQRNVQSLQIMLFDDKGVVATQYYIPLKGGTPNALILHWYGFSGIDQLSDNIRQIQITVHTANESPYGINIGGVMRFPDNAAVKKFLDATDSYVPEKEKKIE